MAKEHFWYSADAHEHLKQYRYEFSLNFGTAQLPAELKPGYVQVLPDGKLATYCRQTAEFDADKYAWKDTVYVGEYDRNDVRSVPADTV